MTDKHVCHVCYGRGTVDCSCSNPGKPEPCDRCRGTGTFTCPECKGSGYLKGGR